MEKLFLRWGGHVHIGDVKVTVTSKDRHSKGHGVTLEIEAPPEHVILRDTKEKNLFGFDEPLIKRDFGDL
jgi:hypothetical protein